MYLFVLWIAKIVQYIVRKRGHGGAALPGLVVERVSKNFLKHYLSQIPGGVVIISGTNGKTTTTKLVVEALELEKKRVFTNRSGSNMTRGLISAVIDHARLSGKMPYDIAVIEVDEAYAAKFVEKIPVKVAVVLNVMRDQLDRFGEIDTTAELLGLLTASATDCVVLNASDKRVSQLPSKTGVKRVYFGLNATLKKEIISEDDWHKTNLVKKNDDAEYMLVGSNNTSCSIKIKNKAYKLAPKLSGIHNHLNLVAGIACLNQLNIYENQEQLINDVEKVEPAFGRGEYIEAGDSVVVLQLIKNPGSFMQTLKACDLKKYDSATIVINDAYADGRDVSWLWDVDFSDFKDVEKIYASGSRAYDLAVRLKHENIKVAHIDIDIAKIAEELISKKGENIIFCTYTAMLSLRKIFVSKGHAEKVL